MPGKIAPVGFDADKEFDKIMAAGGGKTRKVHSEMETMDRIIAEREEQATAISKLFREGVRKDDFAVPTDGTTAIVKDTVENLFAIIQEWKDTQVESKFNTDFLAAVMRILHNPGSATQHDTTEMDGLMYQASQLAQDIREQFMDGKDEAARTATTRLEDANKAQEHEIVSLKAALEISKGKEKRLEAQTSSREERTNNGLLQLKNVQLEADLNQSRHDKATLENEVATLQNEVASLENEIEALEDASEQNDRQSKLDLIQLRQEIRDLRDDRDWQQQRVQSLEDQGLLEQRLLEDQLSSINVELSGQTKQLEDARTQLQNEYGANASLARQLKEWEQKSDKKSERIGELQNELAGLKAAQTNPLQGYRTTPSTRPNPHRQPRTEHIPSAMLPSPRSSGESMNSNGKRPSTLQDTRPHKRRLPEEVLESPTQSDDEILDHDTWAFDQDDNVETGEQLPFRSAAGIAGSTRTISPPPARFNDEPQGSPGRRPQRSKRGAPPLNVHVRPKRGSGNAVVGDEVSSSQELTDKERHWFAVCDELLARVHVREGERVLLAKDVLSEEAYESLRQHLYKGITQDIKVKHWNGHGKNWKCGIGFKKYNGNKPDMDAGLEVTCAECTNPRKNWFHLQLPPKTVTDKPVVLLPLEESKRRGTPRDESYYRAV